MDPLRGSAEERVEVEALLTLQRLAGVGDVGLNALIAAFGSGRHALEAPDADALAGGPPCARPLATADALGIEVVPIGGAAYPARLLELSDPPPLLFLRGRTELLADPSVAVVGSRRATAYGRRTAARLGAALARAGVVVVSGLALGVDGEAHRGALDAGGGTLAVLGAGADVEHPAGHAHLHRAIAHDGLLVSEFAPGTQPAPHHFPRRNRIMAALARAVVVVEAAERSGALITARIALDLGREVLAVPGPIDAPTSVGSNALLADGAAPALGVEVVLRAIGIEEPPRARAAAPAPGVGDSATVWAALDAHPLPVDEIAGRTSLPAGRALAALSLLELEGWAVRSAGGRFARRP